MGEDRAKGPLRWLQGWWALVPPMLLVVLAGASRLWRPETLLDDAWISYRIARNWVEGTGLTFDPAFAPVEGMTNLLWTLLSAIWVGLWPDLDPAWVGRGVGLGLHLGALVLLMRTAAALAGGSGARAMWAAGVAGGLAATSTSLLYNAMSGLETGLWGFLFVLALERAVATRAGDGRAALGCGAALAALAWTRPEGVLAGGLLVLVLGVEREQRRVALLAALPFGAGVLALVGFRWLVYGELVPNTFYAKSPDPASGLVYLKSFFRYGLGWLGPLAILPAVRSGLPRRLALVLLVLVAGTVWSGGDWMPGFRRLTLPLLGFCLLAGVGTAAATATRERMVWVAAGIAAALVANGTQALHLPRRTFAHAPMASLAARVARTPGIEQVALADIGVFSWIFRGSIFDFAGLTDRHIARLPGTHGRKGWDEAYFRERSPELVIVSATGSFEPPLGEDFHVRPLELGVVRSLVLNGGYRHHSLLDDAGNARFWILHREDIRLPEDLWGPPDSRDLLTELRHYHHQKLAVN